MNPPLDNLKDFYNKLSDHENDRFRSFDHCYTFFQKNKDPRNLEMSMLHLAFYLASWGMYRGSSFLLQKDYKTFKDVIPILYKDEYGDLWNIEKKIKLENVNQFAESTLKLHSELQTYLGREREEYYKFIGEDIPKQDVSSILTSKIMMGTIGCIPAYDTYFRKGLKIFEQKNNGSHFIQSFGQQSIIQVYNFLLDNKEELNELQGEIKKLTGMKYPLMKLIDSYFWLIGFEAPRGN